MEALNLIYTLIDNRRFMVFCGAGISKNSGIPPVTPLLTKVLSSLGCEEGHIKSLFSSSFPFEAIMENFKERVDILKFINVFNLKNPNSNHYLIAWLAKHHYLNTIVTTNFDENIEFALQSFGLSKQDDYIVITDFLNFNIETFGDKIVLLKLHGSIQNPESVLANMSKIANRKNSTLMLDVLQQIFNSNRFENILVLGYSFSDHFDINPALLNMPKCDKSIYYIKRQPEDIPQKIEHCSRNIFTKFRSAHKLHCSFESIISNISNKFSLPKYLSKESDMWIKISEEWIAKEFDKDSFTNRYNCLGYLFIAAGFINISKHYATLNVPKITNTIDGKILEMLIADVVGKSYLKDPNERDATEATKHYLKAREIAEELELIHYAIVFTGDLGSCYLMQQKFSTAELLFKEALSYYEPLISIPEKREKIIEKYIRVSIHLAHSYAKRGAFTESIKLYKTIERISEDEGLASCLELCLTGQGLARVINEDCKVGLNLFSTAYPIAKSYGSIDRIRSLFFLICSWMQEVDGIPKAEEFYNSEIKYITNTTGFNRPFNEIPLKLIKDYKYKL